MECRDRRGGSRAAPPSHSTLSDSFSLLAFSLDYARPVDLIGCRARLRFFPGAVHMALAVEDCTIFDNQSGCINIAVDSPRGTYLDLGFRGNAALDRAVDLH